MIPLKTFVSERRAANLLAQIRWRDAWLSPHRGVSKDRLTPYFRAFQLHQRVRRKPGEEALKTILETAL